MDIPYSSRHLLMLKSSSAFMHRNSWGVIWSHPNSWERCLIRTHWLYIRDLCMRYLRKRHREEGEKWRRFIISPRECLLLLFPHQILQEEFGAPLVSTVVARNKVVIPLPKKKKSWHPDSYSSLLVRIWVNTWNFQVPVTLLFPETEPDKSNQNGPGTWSPWLHFQYPIYIQSQNMPPRYPNL